MEVENGRVWEHVGKPDGNGVGMEMDVVAGRGREWIEVQLVNGNGTRMELT